MFIRNIICYFFLNSWCIHVRIIFEVEDCFIFIVIIYKQLNSEFLTDSNIFLSIVTSSHLQTSRSQYVNSTMHTEQLLLVAFDMVILCWYSTSFTLASKIELNNTQLCNDSTRMKRLPSKENCENVSLNVTGNNNANTSYSIRCVLKKYASINHCL